MAKPRPQSISEAFGAELRVVREEVGLTQEDLASRAEVHRTYISLLERGLKSPTLSVIDRLAAAVGLSASSMVAAAEKRAKSSARE